MGNYDWLFYEFEKEETHWDKLPRYQAYFRGSRHIDGAQIYLPYRAFIKEGVISSRPHFHRDEEYLAFVGHDLRNAFELFDAEIRTLAGRDAGGHGENCYNGAHDDSRAAVLLARSH